MLTDTSIELRSPSPSLLMRFVKWLVARRPAVFPHDEAGFHAVMQGRKLPQDAPMPESFRARFLVEEREVLGHKVVTLHPKAGPAEWHMLYFHGGGFVRPMFKEHWPLVAEMVKVCGISVTVPLYPVVPEAPYSAQDDLADAVYAELAAAHDPARIILNGDSAGGHMALALALRLVGAGGPLPGKLALFAPWLDLGLADPAIAAVEPHDIMLKIGTLRACGGLVAAGRPIDDPAVSPLYAAPETLAQLPPTRIWTGRHDIFIVDSRSFLGRLRAAGEDAKLYEYEAAPHVFMAIVPTREAKDALGLLAQFLRAP
jgi:acetyl esterase/lipase